MQTRERTKRRRRDFSIDVLLCCQNWNENKSKQAETILALQCSLINELDGVVIVRAEKIISAVTNWQLETVRPEKSLGHYNTCVSMTLRNFCF